MSLENLGNKQTIILHNCEINNEKYDLVITPHRQSTGYIRTKRQTIKRKILSKQRQITRKRFSKQRNAFSESETSHLQELYRLMYGIYTIELQSPSKFHGIYLLQTDDVDIEFSKVFTEYIKSIQHQNSQRANSIFTNEVFRIIYSYLSILENATLKRSIPLQLTWIESRESEKAEIGNYKIVFF